MVNVSYLFVRRLIVHNCFWSANVTEITTKLFEKLTKHLTSRHKYLGCQVIYVDFAKNYHQLHPMILGTKSVSILPYPLFDLKNIS